MSFLTKKRRDVLEAISRHPEKPLKEIAVVLEVSEEVVRQRLLEVRRAYALAREDCTVYEDYKVKLGWRGRELL